MKKHMVLAVGFLAAALTFGFTAGAGYAGDASSTGSVVTTVMDNKDLTVKFAVRHPGTKVPMHTHKPYVAYFFGPWQGKFTSAEGKTSEKAFNAGDFICASKGKTHAIDVIGTTDQIVLMVEFKTLPEIDCTGQTAKE